jgi:5-hydroxyisourate hydrolase
MSAITTHVLDTSLGRPASGISVVLEIEEHGNWRQLASGATDADGRVRTLLPDGAPLVAATYRLLFSVGGYFEAQRVPFFFKRIVIEFVVGGGTDRYHVPLLLSPFGYTTYRGT